MESFTDVLVEMQRLHVLNFIHRNSRRPVRLSTSWDLASWLRVDIHECSELVQELVDEGFVDPLPDTPNRYAIPLALTPIGRGFLAWAHTLSSDDRSTWAGYAARDGNRIM